MHVDRARLLAGPGVGTIAERIAGIRSLGLDAISGHAEHVELAALLVRDVHPRFFRMEVDVARAEAVTAVGRDNLGMRQHAVLEGESPQRPRILGLAALRLVAAVGDHDRAPRRRHPHLVRIGTELEARRLPDFRSQRAVAIDAVDREPAPRQVVRVDRVTAPRIETDVDCAMRERLRRSVRREAARRRVDAVRGYVVHVRLEPRATIAGGQVQVLARRMRPSLLHERRHADGTARREGSGLDIDSVMRDFVVDCTVEHHSGVHVDSRPSIDFARYHEPSGAIHGGFHSS